jgi:hypothetical protein
MAIILYCGRARCFWGGGDDDSCAGVFIGDSTPHATAQKLESSGFDANSLLEFDHLSTPHGGSGLVVTLEIVEIRSQTRALERSIV